MTYTSRCDLGAVPSYGLRKARRSDDHAMRGDAAQRSGAYGHAMSSLDAGALGWCTEAQLHDHTRQAADEYLAGDPWDALSQGRELLTFFHCDALCHNLASSEALNQIYTVSAKNAQAGSYTVHLCCRTCSLA